MECVAFSGETPNQLEGIKIWSPWHQTEEHNLTVGFITPCFDDNDDDDKQVQIGFLIQNTKCFIYYQKILIVITIIVINYILLFLTHWKRKR